MRMKYGFLFVCFSLLLLVVAPVPAQAEGWLEFFFPSLRQQGPDPSQTLQAPFADPDAVIDEANPATGLQENSTPLHMRHRVNATITEWVEDIVPELMSYSAVNYQDAYKKKSKMLSKGGNKEYVQFLKESKILSTLSSGKYDVRAFVKDLPEIKKEGAVAGRYRWLYQVDVMVSFVPSGLTNYKNARDGETVTQEMMIYLQIGRQNGVENEHGILVETWSGKVVN